MNVAHKILLFFGALSSASGSSPGSDPEAPNAPILDWTSASSDTTPEFNIDFDETAVVGDIVTVEYDDDPLFGSASTATDTLDAGEITASEIDLALSALGDGTYYVRAKIDHDGHVSDWSNTETITIAAASGPAVGDGLLLEDGTSFLLLETGDFLLLE